MTTLGPADHPALSATERVSVRAMLSAYARGWFPMNEDGVTQWVQPVTRGLIPLDAASFRVSRSLRAIIRAQRFRITCDAAFGRVIRACAENGLRPEGTWIGSDIIEAFELLHRAGHAHSVEAWSDAGSTPELVGGLYGLALGSAFCGESMFCRPDLGGTNASKVCLAYLVNHLRRRGFTVLDAQLSNPHLEQFGCYEMEQREYARVLRDAASQHRAWGPWEPAAVVEEATCSLPKPPPPCTGTQSPKR